MAPDNKNKKRSGMGSFLASTRMLFGNRVVRSFLKSATKDAECIEETIVKNAPLIYFILGQFAGEEIKGCPLSARFLSWLIRGLLRIGIKALKGDVDEVRKSLKDPALRRGVATVLKGLGLYGVTVPQKMPAPFLIVWNFTNMCNLRCLHCYQRADKPTPDELTLEEKLNVVDQLDRAGVAMIALSGGEPTIHPHFYRIVKEIADRGIYAAVATNGWVFADIEKLKKAVDLGLRYVEVSVDSADPKKHDYFRGVPGAWQRAVKALENAVKLGVNHAMAVTLTKLNYNEIEDILDLAESIGVKRVVFFNFVPVGRGKENMWLDLTPDEREEALRTMYKEMKKRDLQVVSTAPQYARVVMQLSGGEEVAPTHFYVGGDRIVKAVAEYVGGCGAGRIYAAIEPNGDLTPCVFLPIKVGNLRERTFEDLWENAPLFKDLRDREKLKGICGKCPYKYVCGGCRARAYAYFGDPLAPDPGCIMAKAEWLKLAEKYNIRLKGTKGT
jgi:radical SAM protein with 4Fe4S-binding SPASM domain